MNVAADPVRAGAEAYAAFWQGLDEAGVERLRALAVPEMRFADPFNDVVGIDRVLAVLRLTWEHATEVRIEVLHWALAGQTAYYRWRFGFRPKGFGRNSDWRLDGVSEVRFDAAGRVLAHLDHWDAGQQFYGRLPLLGRLIALVRRRLALKA